MRACGRPRGTVEGRPPDTRRVRRWFGVTEVSARILEETLAEWYEGRDNKSETVREALRHLRIKEDGVGDDRLSEKQERAYQWLREHVGVGESMSLGQAKSEIAQQVSIKKQDLKSAVLQPLNRSGYIGIEPRMHDVRVRVRPPEAAREASLQLQVDEPGDVGERMDALTEAGEEAAES